MIDAGIFTLLTANPSIAALVGSRVYPMTLPLGATLPAITYHLIGTKPGPTFQTSGFQRWRYEFDCWGANYADAISLRGSLRGVLEGYRGVLSDGTLLQDAQFWQAMDFFEDDTRTYRCLAEFYLFFNFSN